MSERFDAAIVGGGVSGLTAAALLAKAGLRTVLLERAPTPFGEARGPALRALDPGVVKALKLARRGLKFAARDLTTTVLRSGGQNVVIGRDRHAVARSLAALSAADAAAFAGYQRTLFALAREMRFTWWEGRPGRETAVLLKPAQRALLERLSVASAASFLSTWFESDALKAALAFAAADCGFSPSESGSALALVWSAAQEMCGLQGAVALPRGGVHGLEQALFAAAEAAGAEIRTGAAVSRLVVAGNSVAGAELAKGDVIAAPLVLSALSRRRTLGELSPTAQTGLGAAQALARSGADIGSATLLLGLNRPPDFGGASLATRFVIAERLETFEAAYAAARLGEMPREPVLELILPPVDGAAAPVSGRLLLSVRIWPVAATSDRDVLTDRVIAMIARHAPGFAASVASCDVLLPQEGAPASTQRLLAGAAERIETGIHGLLLCGRDAEPVDAVSGRAARHAARIAISLHKRAGTR